MSAEGGATAPDPVRRGLLRGDLLTREGRRRVSRQVERLGPWPPGLRAEAGECGDCPGPCAAACPQDIVRFHPPGHGLAGQPWLDFTLAGCTQCGECLEACPQRQTVATATVAIEGAVVLGGTTCLAWNGVLCMSCVGRCGVRALALDRRRRLVVDRDRCSGCGACVAPCPVGALAVRATDS